MIELGVNIDHVATLREARRTYEPDPVWAAVEAHLGGAEVALQVEAADHPIEMAALLGNQACLLDHRSRLELIAQVEGNGIGESPGQVDIKMLTRN